jgi:hypothetical protein
VKEPLKYFGLLAGSEPVVGAVDDLALVLQVRADLVGRLRIVQDIPEDVDVARGDDDHRGDPRSGNEARALHVPVVEGLAGLVVPEEVAGEQEPLEVAVRREPKARHEEAPIVVELVVLDEQVGRQDVELLEERIAHEDAAVRVLAEVIVLDDALDVEGRAQFNAELRVLHEDVVTNLELEDALLVAPTRLYLDGAFGAAVEPIASYVHVRITCCVTHLWGRKNKKNANGLLTPISGGVKGIKGADAMKLYYNSRGCQYLDCGKSPSTRRPSSG